MKATRGIARLIAGPRVFALLLSLSFCLNAAAVRAAAAYWIGGPSNTFQDDLCWMDGIAPTAGDSAIFGGGGWGVNFAGSATTQDLLVQGSTLFASTPAGLPFTYWIQGGNANILGGSLGLDAVNLNVANSLNVQSGAIDVYNGSRLSAAHLDLNGLLSLRTIGNAIAGSANLGNAGALGQLHVIQGGSLSVGSIDASFASGGEVLIADSSSSLIQTGASSLTLGAAGSSASGVVAVSNGGAFTSGTGDITINSAGYIALESASSFNANGDIYVNTSGGTYTPPIGANKNIYVTNGSVFRQNGSKSITIGSLAPSQAGITVDGGGFISGTGDIAVNGYGRIDVANGGLFNANGNVAVTTIGPQGGISLTDSGSAFVQFGATTFTVGYPTSPGGTATVTIGDGTTLVTGTGATTIHQSGVIDLQSGGYLYTNGDVLVDGGALNIASPYFNPAAGTTITARNSGLIQGITRVNNNTTLNVLGAAQLQTGPILEVGKTTNGTLLVDGPGSSVLGGLLVGGLGGKGAVTLRNGATGSFGGIGVAVDGITGTAGTLLLESGAQAIFAGPSSIGNAGNSGAPVGVVTVTGAGSMLAQTVDQTITIGQTSGGSGTLNVTDGGTYSALGDMTVYSTGRVNVDDGILRASNLTFNNGRLDARGNDATPYHGSGITVGRDVNIEGSTLTLQDASQGNVAGSLNVAGGNVNLDFHSTLSVGNVGIVTSYPSDGIHLMRSSVIAQTGDSSLTVGSVDGGYIYGYLDVDQGSTFTTGTGAISVDGGGAIGLRNYASFIANGDMQVGTTCTGYNSNILVAYNSTLVQNGAGALTIGHATAGVPVNVAVSDYSSFTTGTGDILVDSAGIVTISGQSQFNANGNLAIRTGGYLRLQDGDSAFTQLGAKTITIGESTPLPGNPSLTATVAVGNGTTFTTGAGTTTVLRTGLVDVENGTLNTGGDVVVDGGTLRINGGLFVPASGKTITATNAGLIDFMGGEYWLNNSTTVNILEGGNLNTGWLRVGSYTKGTLVVDGLDSSATTNGNQLTIGQQGAGGTVAFRNGATGSFGYINIAGDYETGTAGTLSVESGAQVSFSGQFHVASGYNGSGGNPVGSVTVTGANSMLTQTYGDTIAIGQWQSDPTSGGSAVLNVTDGGTYLAQGNMQVFGSGKVNVDSGVLHTAGSMTFAGGTLDVRGYAPLPDYVDLLRSVTLHGDLTVMGTSLYLQNHSRGNAVAGNAHIHGAGGYAELSVVDGSTLSIGSINVGAGTDDYNDSRVYVQDVYSSITQTGASALVLGKSEGAMGSLEIYSGGSFTAGAGDTTVNATGRIYLDNGTFNANGNIGVNTAGGTGGYTDRIYIGWGSSFTQTGNTSLTVGSWLTSPDSDVVVIDNDGVLSTGTGATTINRSGVINVNGTFNANGDVVVDGGALRIYGTFNPASGKTITARNGGLIESSGEYCVDRNTTVNIAEGGRLETWNPLRVGAGSRGTLVVDGAGSSVTTDDNQLTIGEQGAGGTVAFRNGATGELGDIRVAYDSTPGTAGTLSVESGAQVTAQGWLEIACDGGDSIGSVFVSGDNSLLEVQGAAIGSSWGRAAALNVADGGTFTAWDTTTIDATGSLNIDGGNVNLGPLTINGGKVNFSAGSLQYQGNLDVAADGLLGANLNLTADKSLGNSGSTTIADGAQLAINGGSLRTTEIINAGNLIFNGGTLAGNGTMGPKIVNQTAGTMVVGAGAMLNAAGADIENHGELTLDGGTAAIKGVGTLTNAGVIRGNGKIEYTVQNLAGGELRADFTNRLLLAGGGNTNSGDVTLSFGGTVEARQGLTNNADGAISGDGIIRVGKIDIAGNGTGLFNYGKMNFSGTTKIYGDVWTEGDNSTDIIVSGGATLTFYDDVYMRDTAAGSPKPEIRAGSGSRAVYFGLVKGDVNMTGTGVHSVEGTLSPGWSPGYLSASTLELAPEGTFEFDLAGMIRMDDSVADTTGHYSAYDISTLILNEGGTIDVDLVPVDSPHESGPLFAPSLGQSFRLIDWDALEGDDPSTLVFNFDGAPLSAGLSWQIDWGSAVNGSLTLTVVPEPSALVLLAIALAGAACYRLPTVGRRIRQDHAG